jgi:hypothetical protein
MKEVNVNYLRYEVFKIKSVIIGFIGFIHKNWSIGFIFKVETPTNISVNSISIPNEATTYLHATLQSTQPLMPEPMDSAELISHER